MSNRKGRSAEQVADALRTLETFRAAGFDPVPLAPRSKRPAHKGWQGKDYHNFNWRAWLRDDGNIGLRLGARDAVIDYDPRNAVPGDDPVARLSEAVGVDLKNAPRVLTGNGGAHYFWALPDGVRLRGKLDDYQGVDFKKLGGFVVAAGSLHPETGKPYRLDPTGPEPANVQPAPKALVELVQRPDRPERVEGSGVLEPLDLERLLGVLDPVDYGQGKYDSWIRMCAACNDAVGGGTDGLRVFAHWCARDDAYDNAEAQEAVELHWESFEAGRPNGVTARTLYREVVNAGHGALVRELVGDAERDEAVEALADEPMPEGAEPPEKPRRLEASYSESLGWKEPRMLVDRLLPWNSFVQNYGARKSQKTFVTLDLALCVATGRSYHGLVVQRAVVTFVAAEGSKSRFRDRVTAWLIHNEVDPAELDGWFYMVNVPVNLTDLKARRTFVEGLRGGRRRGLIVFDTVSKNSGGADEDTAGMKAFCHGANEVRLATGATVLVVHHEGKDAGRKGRGSTVLPGDVDMSLRTFKSGAGRCTLTVDEARDVEEGLALSFMLRGIELGNGERAAAVEFVGRRDEESMTTDERVLVAIAESYGSLNSVGDLVDEDRAGFSRPNLYKVVKELRRQGLVEADEVRVTQAGKAEAVRLGAALFDPEVTEQI